MRRKSIYMVAFWAICILVSIQFAFTVLAADDLIVAPQTSANIKIDGDLGEWKLQLFSDEQKIVLTKDNGFINSGTIDGDDDFSAVIYALYDDDDLSPVTIPHEAWVTVGRPTMIRVWIAALGAGIGGDDAE